MALARRLNPFAMVLGFARTAGPNFVFPAKHAERPLGFHSTCSSQGVRATGGAGFSRCELGRSGHRGFAFQRGNTVFQRLDARGQGFDRFPDRQLVEEFDNV